MNPQMKALFPYKGELVSITFIDDNEVTHSAIYQKMRGYMVCLTFGEWWERNHVKEGDTVTIEVVDLVSKTYRLKLNNGITEVADEAEEEVEFKFSSNMDSAITYSEHKVTIKAKADTKNYIEGGKFQKASVVPNEDLSNYTNKYSYKHAILWGSIMIASGVVIFFAV